MRLASCQLLYPGNYYYLMMRRKRDPDPDAAPAIVLSITLYGDGQLVVENNRYDGKLPALFRQLADAFDAGSVMTVYDSREIDPDDRAAGGGW